MLCNHMAEGSSHPHSTQPLLQRNKTKHSRVIFAWQISNLGRILQCFRVCLRLPGILICFQTNFWNFKWFENFMSTNKLFRKILFLWIGKARITDFILKIKWFAKISNLIKITSSSTESNYFRAQHFPLDENVKSSTCWPRKSSYFSDESTFPSRQQ